MPLTSQQRQQTEARIRAAADQLLRGDLPPGGRCDIKTLARTAGVSRAALYRTYPHLKDQFERRLAQARAAGQVTDPRDAQITRLKQEVQDLRQRLASRDAAISGLTDFKTLALSRPAAQHDELQHLQSQAARPGSLRILPSRSASSTPGATQATT
jgi:DNA-binding GntR family transcriptional regulator